MEVEEEIVEEERESTHISIKKKIEYLKHHGI